MRDAQLLAILDAGPIGLEALASLSRERRRVAEAGIAALIAALDAIDPDPEAEPSLGTPEVEFREGGLPYARGHIDQRRWSACARHPTDRLDFEEDTADDEPTMGVIEHAMSVRHGFGFGVSVVDRVCDQTSWARGGDVDERETENEHGGDILDERHDPEEDEPSLGAPENPHDQRHWVQGDQGSRELDHDEERIARDLTREQEQAVDCARREAEAMARKARPGLPQAPDATNVVPFTLVRRAS